MRPIHEGLYSTSDQYLAELIQFLAQVPNANTRLDNFYAAQVCEAVSSSDVRKALSSVNSAPEYPSGYDVAEVEAGNNDESYVNELVEASDGQDEAAIGEAIRIDEAQIAMVNEGVSYFATLLSIPHPADLVNDEGEVYAIDRSTVDVGLQLHENAAVEAYDSDFEQDYGQEDLYGGLTYRSQDARSPADNEINVSTPFGEQQERLPARHRHMVAETIDGFEMEVNVIWRDDIDGISLGRRPRSNEM